MTLGRAGHAVLDEGRWIYPGRRATRTSKVRLKNPRRSMCGWGVKTMTPGMDTVVASISSLDSSPAARMRIQVCQDETGHYGGKMNGSAIMSNPRCRLCSSELRQTFVDLGMSPPCESYSGAASLMLVRRFTPARTDL